jgi:hypothetical protein
MMWMWDNYTTDPKERKVYASPLQATRNQLKVAASIGANCTK